jgi:hypothetical protein
MAALCAGETPECIDLCALTPLLVGLLRRYAKLEREALLARDSDSKEEELGAWAGSRGGVQS